MTSLELWCESVLSTDLPASLDVETSWSTTSQLECDYCAFNLIKSKGDVCLNHNMLDQIHP